MLGEHIAIYKETCNFIHVTISIKFWEKETVLNKITINGNFHWEWIWCGVTFLIFVRIKLIDCSEQYLFDRQLKNLFNT